MASTDQISTMPADANALLRLIAVALLHGLRLGERWRSELLGEIEHSSRGALPEFGPAGREVERVASELLRLAGLRLPYYAAEGAASRFHLANALHAAVVDGVERAAFGGVGAGDSTAPDPEWLLAAALEHQRSLLAALNADGIAVPGATAILAITQRPRVFIGRPGPDQEFRTDWFRDPDGGRLQLAVRWRDGSLLVGKREYGSTRFAPVTSMRAAYAEPLATLLSVAARTASL
jgi:hypothetical protein